MPSLSGEQRKVLERYIDYVLGKVDVLSSEDQQALRNLEELPNKFLFARVNNHLGSATGSNSALASVTSIDLSPFTSSASVKKIGEYCFSGLLQVSSIDLSPFSGVNDIDGGFLTCCGIQSLDLSPLKLLKLFPRHTLSWSKHLTMLDLSVLDQLEAICNFVCNDCSALATVNMSGLKHLKLIGSGFCADCALTSIDFSNTAPEGIGRDFLKCAKVQNLDLSDLLSNVKNLPSHFLNQCSALVEIDLSNCCNHVTEIRELFAYECTSLTKVSLSGLTHALTRVGTCFLHRCSSLVEVDISGCVKLASVGDSFCSGCKSLEKLNMSNLPSLAGISARFVHGCSSLTSVDFSGTENLKTFGASGFVDSSITTLDLRFLANAVKIGSEFFSNPNSHCQAPCEFSNLHMLNKVKKIQDPYLEQKVKTAVEKAAVRQMIVRMVYTLGFRTSKTVPAGKALRASRPRRLVIEFLLPSPSIDVPFKWGFDENETDENEKKNVLRGEPAEEDEDHVIILDRKYKNGTSSFSSSPYSPSCQHPRPPAPLASSVSAPSPSAASTFSSVIERQVDEAQKREEAANARTRAAESKLLEKQEEILQLQKKLLDGVIKKYL